MQWQGTRDIAAWLTVPQAIGFLARHDWPAVRVRCHELARHAVEVLTQRHDLAPIARDDDWAQLVAIPIPSQDPETLRQRLYDESRIEIPITSHAGRVFVRLSVQGYNTAEDIERLLAAPALR
jgi:isopenicillin-N epimerase